jgi:acyl-coenzyme A thioesterase 13
MTNSMRNLHGACAMYLVDMYATRSLVLAHLHDAFDRLTTLPLCALDIQEGGSGAPGVSQAIHTVFHAPAKVYVPPQIFHLNLLTLLQG